MNEISELVTASPQAAIAGATVYLILTTRRIESRVETLADYIGAPPKPRKNRRWTGLLALIVFAALLIGCR